MIYTNLMGFGTKINDKRAQMTAFGHLDFYKLMDIENHSLYLVYVTTWRP